MMNQFLHLAMAQPPPAGHEANPTGQLLNTIVLFAVMGVMFYFLLVRPQQRQRKEHDRLISNVKSGDEILTTGGIYGIVTNVKDKEITVKIADNVKVRLAKSAIAGVVKRSESDSAAS